MDRENIFARGWSHALSTTNDLDELRGFCERVGAPPSALHLSGRWPHLDLKLAARDRALAAPDVRVFERTSQMLRFLKAVSASHLPAPSNRVQAKIARDDTNAT